jgi:hypothetical protein
MSLLFTVRRTLDNEKLALDKASAAPSDALERRTGPSVSFSYQKLDFLDLTAEKYDICK